MSVHHDDELDPELAYYVAAFRDAEQPTSDSVARNLAAVRAAAMPPARRWIPWMIGGTLAAAGILVWFLGNMELAVFAHRDEAREQAPFARPSPGAEPVTAAPAHPPKAFVTPPPQPADATPEPPPPTSPAVEPGAQLKRPRNAAPTPAPVPGEEASALAQETRLWRSVQSQLRAGAVRQALESIAEWKQRFRNGRFADERTLLEARALCAAGQHDGSRALRDAFVHGHPSSPLVGQMRAVCSDVP